MNIPKILNQSLGRSLQWASFGSSCKSLVGVLLIMAGLILSFTASHFQASPGAGELWFDLVIFLICCLGFIITLKIQLHTWILVMVSTFPLLGFSVGYFFLQLGVKLPYELVSRFGAGTLIRDNVIFPFGDLAQLTYAAKCAEVIKVGSVACDPFNRPLNQNPDVVYFFRLFNITNTPFIALASLLFLTFAVVNYLKVHKINRVYPAIFLLSPVFFLASERGNEIITILLILLGFSALESGHKYIQLLGSITLGAASIFKLWPLIICFLLIFSLPRTVWSKARITLLVPIFYWALNWERVRTSLQATQTGDPFGSSFGAKLLLHQNVQPHQFVFLLLFSITLATIYISALVKYSEVLSSNFFTEFDSSVLIATIGTYLSVWLIGDSFSYRLLIFLPIILLLSRPTNVSNPISILLVFVLLATVWTIRLPITLAISNACGIFLLIFFLYLIIHQKKLVASWSRGI